MPKRILKGKVVSAKMDKTVVVLVEKLRENQKYQKKYRVSKKYQAHDEKNQYHLGDLVEIIESRPISKNKHWQVIRKINPIRKRAKSNKKDKKSENDREKK